MDGFVICYNMLNGGKQTNLNAPVPLQYLHLLFSCCSTLLASIIIRAEITPTAPPEKDATMGSTWLHSANSTN